MANFVNWTESAEYLVPFAIYTLMAVLLGWRLVNLGLRLTHHDDLADKSVTAFLRSTAYLRWF